MHAEDLTVGDIRMAIRDLPDDAPVVIEIETIATHARAVSLRPGQTSDSIGLWLHADAD